MLETNFQILFKLPPLIIGGLGPPQPTLWRAINVDLSLSVSLSAGLMRSTRRSLVINSRKLAREQPTLTANNFVWYLMHISAPVSGSETLLNYRCICRGLFMCVKCIDADRYAERAGATRGEESVGSAR